MRKKNLLISRIKMQKKVVAIVMAFSLFFSGVSVSGAEKNTIRENYAITTSEEKSLTAKQKEQIKKEDAERFEQIENVKASKKNSDKRTVVKELKKYRTENSNTYLLSDGSKKIEIFGEDIRFKEDGKYVEYNSS